LKEELKELESDSRKMIKKSRPKNKKYSKTHLKAGLKKFKNHKDVSERSSKL